MTGYTYYFLLIVVGLMISVLFQNISLCNYSLKGKLIISGTVILETVILRSTIDYLVIPVWFITLFFISHHINKKSIGKSVFYTSLAFLTFYVVDALVRMVCVLVLGNNNTGSAYFYIPYISFTVLLTIAFSRIIGQVIKANIEDTNHITNKNPKNYLILGNILFSFIIVSASYLINKTLNITDARIYIVNLFLFLICILSSIVVVHIFNKYSTKELEVTKKNIEMKNIEEYSKTIEDLYENIRKFKHDYKNILLSLGYYIEEKKFDELEQFFKENILKSEDYFFNNDFIFKLKNLYITPLKALIASKLLKASNNQLIVFTDINEEIHNIPMDYLDLIRIFGILLDNAIEGAIETEEKKLNFGAVYKGNSLVFIIENSCRTETPPVFKLLEKDFSTKGDGRGVGLNNVKDILKQYDICTLNIEVINCVFKAEIWITLI